MKTPARLPSVIAFLLIPLVIFSGCANTIPSRAENAVQIHPTALYPVSVFIFPFADKRPGEQKLSAKKTTWPGSKGRVDYYGEDVPSGLADALAAYLTASRVFNKVDHIDFVTSNEALKAKGYRLVLSADLQEFSASLSVPKLVLGFALVPNPFFFILPGITLLPLALWPKKMTFDAILDNIRLKDLRTGQMVWEGKVEIRESKKKMSSHVTAQWYLGESGELLAKELVQKFQNAGLKL